MPYHLGLCLQNNPPFTSLVLNSSAITINPNKHFSRVL
uniref:Uncharacterized protein n=1 Tax=Dulem virus 39 TaxID=3145757 RepID=A0AAU8B7N0_9CAUD